VVELREWANTDKKQRAVVAVVVYAKDEKKDRTSWSYEFPDIRAAKNFCSKFVVEYVNSVYDDAMRKYRKRQRNRAVKRH